MIRGFVLSFFIALLVSSCDSNSVFAEYKTISGGWAKNDTVSFTYNAIDTITPYNMFINLRNDQKYRFANLFLIVNMEFPNNETITDTLEYEMALPNGEWLGEGFSSVKESKLWYKENVVFPEIGRYRITLEQAMRKVGSIEGVEVLEGITDIGLKIEKANNQ